MAKTIFHTCPLCEATCGLAFEVENNEVLSVRPDQDDVFSKGFVCPKGIATAEIHNDPDRVRQPLRRDADGNFQPIGWEEALDLAASKLRGVREAHGANSVGFYWGNPLGNNYGALLLLDAFTAALGTKNRFSAGSQDATPRLLVSYLLYGSSASMPIPDIDRSDYFLCIGANPLVSNGSVMTAPDMKGRLKALRNRGGKVVVIDPRRTETAQASDEYVAVRPGTDAALLLSMVAVLVEDGLADRRALDENSSGFSLLEPRLKKLSPESTEQFTGVAAATVRRLAHEFAAAPTAVAYSRMGVAVGTHATLANYATDLLNIAGGRLGKIGGALSPDPAFDIGQLARMADIEGYNRWQSRVGGLPEIMGDLPATVLAREMETPGDGQIRAMVTYAGNPALSAPNGKRLAEDFSKLEFMVSIDIYVNETTRHADLILPPCWQLAEEHIDLLFSAVSVRNVARWSPPVVTKREGEKADWEILLELCERLGGGPTGSPFLDPVFRLAKPLGLKWTPTLVADLLLRLGSRGDKFLPWSDGLNLKRLAEAPHGIDFGPMQEGFERRVYHKGQRIQLAPELILKCWDALESDLGSSRCDDLVLIGRRELRTNNSWMHNAPSLMSGRNRCTLFVHPDDATRFGVSNGADAVLESRVHCGNVTVEVTDEMMPGVVSLPHGYGHAPAGAWQRVAGEHAGVSANDWTDDEAYEPLTGQSILNGVPVQLRAA